MKLKPGDILFIEYDDEPCYGIVTKPFNGKAEYGISVVVDGAGIDSTMGAPVRKVGNAFSDLPNPLTASIPRPKGKMKRRSA